MWLFPKPATRKSPPTIQQVGNGLAEDVEKLRRDNVALQEKLLVLRETDILNLKDQISDLKQRLWLITTIVAVVVGVATFFGVRQYRDLQALIRDSFKEQLDKSFGYYDKFMRARVLAGDNKFKAAEVSFQELWNMKPDDELVFVGLIDCLIQQQNIDGACALAEKAESSGTFPRKCQGVLCFNNPGYAFLVRDIDQPAKLDKALRLLKQAEEQGNRDEDPDRLYPLFNLALYYVAIGDMSRARAYAARWRELDNAPWVEPSSQEHWYERLVRVRPEARAQMREIFAPIVQPAASPTPPPDRNSSGSAP
jgi:tetratricopeptide (TPR) repeat protein